MRLVGSSVVLGVSLASLGAGYAWGCAATRPSAATSTGARPDMTPPAAAASADAADPTTTDPDHYRAVLENARVRVLRYHDDPGARTHAHHHPDSVLYALSSFRRRLVFPDGTSREREFAEGDVMWIPAQTHVGENIGTTPTEVLLVEVR